VRNALVFAACIAVSTAWAVEALHPADFAFGSTLSVSGQESLYRVTLPFFVHARAQRADLGDLRVFNGAGDVVPHAFLPHVSEEATKRPALPVPFFPLRGAAAELDRATIQVERNGTIVKVAEPREAAGAPPVVAYLVDASALEDPIQALELDWTPDSEGFSGAVHVDVSDDLQSWRTLVRSAPLLALDYGGQKLEQKKVAFAPGKAKYLRITWPSRQPLALTAVKLQPADAAVPATRSWQNVAASSAKESGEYRLDFSARAPVDRIRIELPQNTLIAIEFLVRDDSEKPWRSIYRGVFYRLLREGETITNPDAELSPTVAREWLLRVDTRAGGLGSALPVVQFGWTPVELVFVAQGDPPYQLAYGNPRITGNGMNAATLVPGYDRRKPPRIAAATLSAEHALGGERRLGREFDWKTWILWAVLVAAVAALAAMAWRLSRQVREEDAKRT
jgi:hypothetical protein